jgi:hypothetical protein
MNLVVFPQKLQKGSRIVYLDKAAGKSTKSRADLENEAIPIYLIE